MDKNLGLVELTKKVFEESSLEQNEVQQEYAREVARTLENTSGEYTDTQIGLLEGETGVGKTLGYLIPLLLYHGTTGERVAVSTFTLSLQDQIVKGGGDLEFAITAVRKVLGRSFQPVAKVRKGLNNFVSLEKVKTICKSYQDFYGKLPDEFQELKTWAENSVTGEIQEWFEYHDSLPGGLSLKQITLEISDDEEDKARYRESVEQAKNADILILNHATSLVHAMNGFKTLDHIEEEDEDNSLQVIIFDEADRLNDAARLLQSNDLSLLSLFRTINAVNKEIGGMPKAKQAAKEVLERWQEQGAKHSSFMEVEPNLNEDSQLLIEDLKNLQGIIAKTMPKNGQKKVDLRHQELVADIQDKKCKLDKSIRAIQRPSGNIVPTMRWSPTKKYPALNLMPLNPGQAVKIYLSTLNREQSYLKAAVFTSATLNPHVKKDMMGQDLGITPKYNYIVAFDRFEPERYGEMEFVLPDFDVPYPFKNDDELENEERKELNPEWCKFLVKMIEEARNAGGRTLVLTPSYAEVEKLGEMLSNPDKLFLQKRGERLGPQVEKFKQDNSGVLITPAGWTGLDLPYLVDNLVITRIPFPPPDDVYSRVKQNFLIEKRGMSFQNARKTIFLESRGKTLNRLRQGLGRGIRGKDDTVTVWIADPRFPWPEANHSNEGRPKVDKKEYMLKAISRRFRVDGISQAPFNRARLLSANP